MTYKTIAEALAKFQSEIVDPVLDCKNPHYGSPYASITSILKAVRPVMAKHGLSVTQIPTLENDKLILKTIVLHSSGETIEGNYPLNPVKQDPQGIGSAITYAKRYALNAMLGLGDEDDDGNAASKPPEETKSQSGNTSYGYLSDKQIGRMYAIAKKSGYTQDTMKQVMKKLANTDDVMALSKITYDIVCSFLEKNAAEGFIPH